MRLLSRIPVAARIAFSLMLIVGSAISGAATLGLYPDQAKFVADSRARIAEALTIQIAMAVSRKQVEFIRDTLAAIDRRDDGILSIGLRTSDGNAIAQSSRHETLWQDADPEGSTETHIKVPITDGERRWGWVEIVFEKASTGWTVLGLPFQLITFTALVCGSVFIGGFTILRLTLKELDPNRSVPTRVQAAFDLLSEGIAIVDENDKILLVNQSLAGMLGAEKRIFTGRSLGELLWRYRNSDSRSASFPWLTSIRDRETVRDVPMNLRSPEGGIINILVSASCITGKEDAVVGALVTLKDVTVVERKNRDLSLANARLQHSEAEIRKQNRQLTYLANHDPLTSCLNRRALFEQFEQKSRIAASSQGLLTCMMLDIDHFKSVNDTFGHSTGDAVIAGLGHELLKMCRESDIVGRYGGEEFCVVLEGVDIEGAVVVAERLRGQVRMNSPSWLQHDRILTISIGIAAADSGVPVGTAIDHADQALYEAKRTGRNKVVLWTGEESSAFRDGSAVIGSERSETPSRAGRATDSSSLGQFLHELRATCEKAGVDGSGVALFCIDLEDAREIASRYGKEVADSISQAVLERLGSIVRDAEIRMPMSGHERTAKIGRVENGRFLLALTRVEDHSSASLVLDALSQKLSVPIDVPGCDMQLRFAIGASIYQLDAEDADSLFPNAVRAVEKARADGKGKAALFSTGLSDLGSAQAQLERGIREALARDEFHLHYQPIIHVAKGEVNGVEVLLRSNSRLLKGKSIEAVIRTAEQTGLIHEISNMVFRQAFKTARSWKEAGLPVPMLSINVSAEQLKNSEVVFAVLAHAEDHGIDPASVQLELTETAMVTDIESAANILHSLQSHGFHIALDDFGTGRSSLSHLLRINPDAIKIDKSFVHSLTTSHANQILVTTIAELSGKIGARVIAEGVETTDQLGKLAEIGCDHAQGYLFSPPLPADAFQEWLRQFGRHSETDAIDEPHPEEALAVA